MLWRSGREHWRGKKNPGHQGRREPRYSTGRLFVRLRRTSDISCDATRIGDLINWSEDVSEPPLTCSLSTSELKNFIDSPMKVPDWSCHTQSIERVIRMVTEASSKYFSHEKRDGGIRVQERSRRLMSRDESKQDLCALVKFNFWMWPKVTHAAICTALHTLFSLNEHVNLSLLCVCVYLDYIKVGSIRSWQKGKVYFY